MDEEKSQLVEKRSLSEIDSAETSQADDDEQLRGLLSKRHREKRRKDVKTILAIVFLFFMAATNVVLFSLLKAEQSKTSKEVSSPGVAYATADVGREDRVFEMERLFSTPPTEENTKAWENLMPKGKGFVTIDHSKNQDLNLPKMNLTLDSQHAMVSVFHQIHCLYMIREGYYSTLDGKPGQVPSNHLDHCFDYLRQAIMCFSDMTLEWLPNQDAETYYLESKGSTGWGYQHTCRNFDEVRTWAEERRWREVSGIH